MQTYVMVCHDNDQEASEVKVDVEYDYERGSEPTWDDSGLSDDIRIMAIYDEDGTDIIQWVIHMDAVEQEVIDWEKEVHESMG